MPHGVRECSFGLISASVCTALSLPLPLKRGAVTSGTISIKVFQAPQSAHWPAHLGCTAAQAAH
jgi:hypothetical protein